MLDFLTLQTTSAHPTIVTIIYTALLAFVLSTLIAITYEKTYRGLSYSRNFVQALILSSIVAATVMQAIGDSLARGLGIIGALAIIRFRTVFKDPRDIIFMFASLAAGISCGVFGFTVGVIGTLAFCSAAFGYVAASAWVAVAAETDCVALGFAFGYSAFGYVTASALSSAYALGSALGYSASALSSAFETVDFY